MSTLPRKFGVNHGDALPSVPNAPKPAAPAPATKQPTKPMTDWSKSMPSDKPPKLVRLRLTDWAEAEADDFERSWADRGCTCFISPPCSYCTHEGNPSNLAEDDDAWVMGYGPGDEDEDEQKTGDSSDGCGEPVGGKSDDEEEERP